MYLAYGVCAGPTDNFERLAGRSIRRYYPDSPILVRRSQTSIFAAYNSIIDEARDLQVDGLVLLHDDVEVCDSAIASKLSQLFSDTTVGIVGVVGGSNMGTPRWWEHEPRGRIAQLDVLIDYGLRRADVDMVDGVFMALSPKALYTIRFDERHYTGFHGYDVDTCMQAKAQGLRVVVAPIDVKHAVQMGDERDASYLRSYRMWRAKWGPAVSLSRRERLVRLSRCSRRLNQYIDLPVRLLHP